MDPDQTAPLEKFARIFSRQHKQTTLSDAGFLGILKVKGYFRYFSYFIMMMYMDQNTFLSYPAQSAVIFQNGVHHDCI